MITETDILAPNLYLMHFSSSALGPEKRLMLAILEDAIDCLQDYAQKRNGVSERLFLEASEWISANDSDWPFSFENICATLGLNSDYLRSGLSRKYQIGCVTPAEKSQLAAKARIDGRPRSRFTRWSRFQHENSTEMITQKQCVTIRA